MGGEKKANKKLKVQFMRVARAACLALVFEEKDSPTKIQIPGAQVEAYPKMNMQPLMMRTCPTWRVSAFPTVPTMANTKSQKLIHTALRE